MLPQMMPLPWIFVFFLVFLGIFIMSLVVSSGYKSFFVKNGFLKIKSVIIPW